MMKMRFWVILLCCVILIPGSVQARIGEFTLRDELELARKFDLIIETRFPVVHDPYITGYVQTLVDRLVMAMPPQPFPIKVTVVRHGALNAFATAGGHIAVFTGLLSNLDSEDELASVIAHELAHVSERHIAQAIEKSKILGVGSLLGILAGVLLGTQGEGDAASALMIGTMAGTHALQLQHTRENEVEADQYGLDFLIGAGFAPYGMTGAFEKIRRLQWLSGGGDIPSYLSTHPGMDDRLGYIQDRIKRLPEAVRQRQSDNALFLRAQMLVRAWYADPNTAMALFAPKAEDDQHLLCLKTLGRSIAHSRLKQKDLARTQFKAALSCYPRDALWKREFGRFAFESGTLEESVLALQDAIMMNPADLFALFFYARAVAEQGNYTASVAAMERVAKAVPRDPEVLENLARYQAATNNLFDAYLNYAQAFAYRHQFGKYGLHLQKAEKLAESDKDKERIKQVEQEVSEYQEILKN